MIGRAMADVLSMFEQQDSTDGVYMLAKAGHIAVALTLNTSLVLTAMLAFIK